MILKDNSAIFDDAIVTPTICSPIRKYTGAVYDKNGCLYKRSNRDSEYFVSSSPEHIDINISMDEIIEPSIYLGHLSWHYGHFLFESLARMWALLDTDNIKYKLIFNKWITNPTRSHQYKENWLFDFAEAFNFSPENVLILDNVTKFRRLHVPDLCFNLPKWSSDNNYDPSKFSEVFNIMIKYSSQKKCVELNNEYKKIYISRPENCQRIGNHKDIEGIFQSYGFKIIDTSLYNLYNQIHIYNNANILASIEGSGAHNSVFLKHKTPLIIVDSQRSSEKITIQSKINQINEIVENRISYRSRLNNNHADLILLQSDLDVLMKKYSER